MTTPPQPKGKPSTWQAAAQELAKNPDSPASLQLMSAFNAALRPHQQAIDQLVEALALRQDDPASLAAQARVAAATAHWERVCGGPLDAATLTLFEEDARVARDQAKRKPPALESILGVQEGRTDYGYDLGGDLGGLRGTWHRLWAALVLEGTMGELDGLSVQLRSEFEQKLGRQLQPHEWDALSAQPRRVSELAVAAAAAPRDQPQ